jgi:cytochrome d ubiquinol oxidase subunit I
MLWTLWAWHRRRLTPELVPGQKGLLWTWVAFVPLGYLAVELGWITREVGRQPWVIYGLMRTADGASLLPASAVATSLAIYLGLYTVLFLAFLVFAWRILKQGPDLGAAPPGATTGSGGK